MYTFSCSFYLNLELLVMQAGCVVKTGCLVHYVVKNSYETDQNGEIGGKRRWLVYLNDTDYIKADFVILSGINQW